MEETTRTEANCVYCQRVTTWSVTEIEPDWIRFECIECCKISRDLHLAS